MAFSLTVVSLIHVAAGAIVGTGPNYSAPIDQWPKIWSDPDCQDVLVIPAKCLELRTGFELKTVDNVEFIHAPEIGNNHGGCSPQGIVGHGPDPNCGRAVARIYCHEPAVVGFTVEGQTEDGDGGAGNDDSFWTWFDYNTSYWQMSGFRYNTWRLIRVPMGLRYVEAGEHTLVLSEREDGTRLKSLHMTNGYPSCHFGTVSPSRNDSEFLKEQLNKLSEELGSDIQDLEGRVADVEDDTDLNTDSITGINTTIDNLNSTQMKDSTSLHTAIKNLQTENGNLKQDVSDLKSQVTSLLASVSNLNTTVAMLMSRLNERVNTFTAGSPTPTSSSPFIETQGDTININANGKIQVNGDTCSMDICAMGKQLEAVTNQINKNFP